MNIARIFTNSFMLSLLAVISTVLGCRVLSTGQGRTWSFTVTGFTLPVFMVYSTATNVQAQVSGIASSKGAAQGFVQRLVIQTVRWQRFNFELFLIFANPEKA
ncbi:hypothetical protein KIN20_018788 [Parelaphostrongylus tenuis]|uniref:Uncharacterized protein n=1 Tax=Parelaphostrongylus tenuis TaxID=148309 RepID=A0AAD5QPV1_PARTN|nr:hypothetical protein KIN20_018788 [Parelaphostrongylus tenuis]